MSRRSFLLSASVAAAPLKVLSWQGSGTPATGASAAAAKLEELRTATGAPALQAAVIAGGTLAWSAAVGQGDLEWKAAASPSTRFRVGSISKLFTATAAARLFQDGLLDLDAPVQTYVPAFPDKGAPITARQLAGHLAGIRHYGQNDYVNRIRYDSVAASLGSFANDPLRFAPGTRYAYSTFGYTLLAAAIEAAAKASFEDYVSRAVLTPAGLTRTGFDRPEAILDGRAGCYERDGASGVRNGSYIDLSDRWGAGGFLSTAEDLVRFAAASIDGQLISARTRDVMLTSLATADGKPTGVGLGWRLAPTAGPLEFAHHGGEAIGGRGFLLMIPSRRAAVAILANLGGARFGEKEALALLSPFLA